VNASSNSRIAPASERHTNPKRRGIAIGPSDLRAERPWQPEVAQKGGDRLVSLVLERLGRHRHQGVVGAQSEDVVDVIALNGIGETSH
jgi:hypothetical protein